MKLLSNKLTSMIPYLWDFVTSNLLLHFCADDKADKMNNFNLIFSSVCGKFNVSELTRVARYVYACKPFRR